jgi:signal transduction histidine kinase
MSHEFRNPLNSILCSIEVLKTSGLDCLAESQLELIDTVANCGEILLHLVNNILDVSKLASESLELAISGCDLRALV